jgi:hypothetical protein
VKDHAGREQAGHLPEGSFWKGCINSESRGVCKQA